MKRGSHKFVMGMTPLILTSLILLACLCSCAVISVAQQKEPEKLDREASGRPFRENLPNGGYRDVTTNKKRQRIQEEEYDGLGVRTRRKEIKTVHPNGEEAEVEIVYYGVRDGEAGVIVKREAIKSDNRGRPTEKVTLTDFDPQTGWQTRSTTTYPPGSGPEGVSRTEKKNPTTGNYEPAPSPSPPSAPGQKTTTSELRYNPFEFYVGYSHNRVDAGDEREGFNGFAASFTGNVNRYVGLKGYYSYHTKSFEENGFDFSPRASIHQIFVGGEIKDNAREGSRFLPFVHGMAGVAHHRFNFDDGVGSFSDSRTGFAGVIGGGIDFRVNDRVDFRIQFDYNPNHIEDEWQHNARAGFGVVFKFGGGDASDRGERSPFLASGAPAQDAPANVKPSRWKFVEQGGNNNPGIIRDIGQCPCGHAYTVNSESTYTNADAKPGAAQFKACLAKPPAHREPLKDEKCKGDCVQVKTHQWHGYRLLQDTMSGQWSLDCYTSAQFHCKRPNDPDTKKAPKDTDPESEKAEKANKPKKPDVEP